VTVIGACEIKGSYFTYDPLDRIFVGMAPELAKLTFDMEKDTTFVLISEATGDPVVMTRSDTERGGDQVLLWTEYTPQDITYRDLFKVRVFA
jgi:hypothetical protein